MFRPANHTCVYCGWDGRRDSIHYMLLSIDHLIPRALGGTSDLENLVCACIPCNRLKGHFNAMEALRRELANNGSVFHGMGLRDRLIAVCKGHIEMKRSIVQHEFDKEMREAYGKKVSNKLRAVVPDTINGATHNGGAVQGTGSQPRLPAVDSGGPGQRPDSRDTDDIK